MLVAIAQPLQEVLQQLFCFIFEVFGVVAVEDDFVVAVDAIHVAKGLQVAAQFVVVDAVGLDVQALSHVVELGTLKEVDVFAVGVVVTVGSEDFVVAADDV